MHTPTYMGYHNAIWITMGSLGASLLAEGKELLGGLAHSEQQLELEEIARIKTTCP